MPPLLQKRQNQQKASIQSEVLEQNSLGGLFDKGYGIYYTSSSSPIWKYSSMQKISQKSGLSSVLDGGLLYIESPGPEERGILLPSQSNVQMATGTITLGSISKNDKPLGDFFPPAQSFVKWGSLLISGAGPNHSPVEPRTKSSPKLSPAGWEVVMSDFGQNPPYLPDGTIGGIRCIPFHINRISSYEDILTTLATALSNPQSMNFPPGYKNIFDKLAAKDFKCHVSAIKLSEGGGNENFNQFAAYVIVGAAGGDPLTKDITNVDIYIVGASDEWLKNHPNGASISPNWRYTPKNSANFMESFPISLLADGWLSQKKYPGRPVAMAYAPYPNPTSRMSSRITVPIQVLYNSQGGADAVVSIKVFDLLGRELPVSSDMLKNGSGRFKKGNYDVSLNLGNIAVGRYFVQVNFYDASAGNSRVTNIGRSKVFPIEVR